MVILFNNILFNNIIVILIGSLILFFFLKYSFEDCVFKDPKSLKLKENFCGNCKSLIDGNCIELNMSIAKHEKACFMFDSLDKDNEGVQY